MMLVAAIVKPFALDDVRTEPERLEVSGMAPVEAVVRVRMGERGAEAL